MEIEWVITGWVLPGLVATLVIWLHYDDTAPLAGRPPEPGKQQQRYDQRLRKHISGMVVAMLWPIALPVLALVGLRWVYRWLRFAAGGAYPG